MMKGIAMEDMAGRISLEISAAFTISIFVSKFRLLLMTRNVDSTVLSYQAIRTPHPLFLQSTLV